MFVLVAAALLCIAAPGRVQAQLVPSRLYYGVDRAIPMTVTRPEGATGALTVQIQSVAGKAIGAGVSVSEGEIDLAALFPMLWENPSDSVQYAQLLAGDAPVGPGVVLQPMVSPNYAHLIDPRTLNSTLDPRGGQVMFEDDRFDAIYEAQVKFAATKGEPAPETAPERYITYSGLRAYPERHVLMNTSAGEIEFRLRPDMAPNTVWNFRHLVDGGFYTDIEFHRIVGKRSPDQPPFVVQGGDPTAKGTGGPGYLIDLEDSVLPHDFGVISMARSDDPNSNGSQFFICLSREATAILDGRYTAFGEAIRGADVIKALGETPPTAERPIILESHLVEAPPRGTNLQPVTRPADGPTVR